MSLQQSRLRGRRKEIYRVPLSASPRIPHRAGNIFTLLANTLFKMLIDCKLLFFLYFLK